ncbi:hypothetical protein DENIT_80071 [Pseudomonas veronii]|nr:hypothetical protein DENIT_80071 [Pseudomonas veronii]
MRWAAIFHVVSLERALVMEYPIKAQRYIAPGATAAELTTVNSRRVRRCPKIGAQGA